MAQTFRLFDRRLRGAGSWEEALNRVLFAQTPSITRKISPRIRQVIVDVERWHRLKFKQRNRRLAGRAILRVKPLNPFLLARYWLRAVTYMERMPENFKENLVKRFQRLADRGEPFSRLKLLRAIRMSKQVARNRIKLIADDQVFTMTAQLNQQRHAEVGVDSYEWITVGDDRVRATHELQHGEIYQWSEPPPSTGHPGTEINCRCVAAPVYDQRERRRRPRSRG